MVNKIVADAVAKALRDVLHKAVDDRDTEVVRAILNHEQHGFNINAKKDGVTPLIRAVQNVKNPCGSKRSKSVRFSYLEMVRLFGKIRARP